MNRTLLTLSLTAVLTSGLCADEKDGCFGTTIHFVDTPKEAAALAKKEEKLVFILHVSGNFEDPRFT